MSVTINQRRDKALLALRMLADEDIYRYHMGTLDYNMRVVQEYHLPDFIQVTKHEWGISFQNTKHPNSHWRMKNYGGSAWSSSYLHGMVATVGIMVAGSIYITYSGKQEDILKNMDRIVKRYESLRRKYGTATLSITMFEI